MVELAGVRDDLPSSYSNGCHLSYDVSKPRTDCIYGDPEGEKTAFLIGDSHAAQWLPALDAYAAKKGWRLETHTKSSCSVVDVPLFERRLRRTYDECFQWRDAVLKRIKKAQPEVVFVASSRDYDLWSNGSIIRTNEAYTYWQEKLTELLKTLKASAGRVVLLAEMPFLTFDPVDCLADSRRTSCDPPTSLVIDTDYAALEAAAAKAAGASVLSLNDVLCPGRTCPVMVDDIVVFRDTHHLTASYMEHLAEPVANLLEGRPPFPSPSPSVVPVARSLLGAPAPQARSARPRWKVPCLPYPVRTPPSARNQARTALESTTSVGSRPGRYGGSGAVRSSPVSHWSLPRWYPCVSVGGGPCADSRAMPTFRSIPIRRAATAALAGAMILTILPAATTLAAPDAPPAVRAIEWKFLVQMNQARERHGLGPLRMDSGVREVARDRSRSMRDGNYFDHVSPAGVTAGDMLRNRHIQHNSWSEVIAATRLLPLDESPAQIMDAWMRSEGHRNTILSSDFNYAGVGLARSGNGAIYYTIVFANQRDHTPPKAGLVSSQTGISVSSTSESKPVTVRWWGKDRKLAKRTAGLRGFTVQYRRADGKWRVLYRMTKTRQFSGDLKKGTHQFRVRATDNRGNQGAWMRPLTVTVN